LIVGIIIAAVLWRRRMMMKLVLRMMFDTFKQMLHDRTVPTNVWTEYMRAVRYAQERRIELVAKQGVIQADVNIDELDKDEADQHLSWLHSSQFTDAKSNPILSEDKVVDIGLNHDWSVGFFEGVRDVSVPGADYTIDLREQRSKVNNDADASTSIPTKSDGTRYSIDDLSFEQRVIVLATIDTVVKFLTNDADYKPLRATITGMGGCGKSLIINTIISIVRELTHSNTTRYKLQHHRAALRTMSKGVLYTLSWE